MDGQKRAVAPQYLRPATRAWWRSVVNAWVLEPHHVRLLTLACESWDRGQQAREQIERDGLTSPTRDGGWKRHPAVAIEAESRIAFTRLLRELDLDVVAPAEGRRPPALQSIRGGRGAA